jgi:predicted acylesterase/phospholipase RssA
MGVDVPAAPFIPAGSSRRNLLDNARSICDRARHPHERRRRATMSIPIEPPEDRFCDLVMKGGITSGVVYPAAIERLSHHYRFKNIGGTSAGAIAAAVTAAAEFNRRCSGSRAGFELLKQLPSDLKEDVTPGRRKLLSLFQPQRDARRLFTVLVAALNSRGTGHRIFAIIGGLLRAYWIAALGSVLIALAIRAVGADGLGSVLVFGIALVIWIGAWVFRDITVGVVGNGFGMCTGLTEHPKEVALTPWLHELIQRAAGRTAQDPPLTFGELWDAPGYPIGHFTLPAGALRKSIDLRMFSTNLGHGRPYIFPFTPAGPGQSRFPTQERLFFRPDELARYLPGEVLAWMRAKGMAYRVEPGREGRDPSGADAASRGLLELPPPREFPVILAARMSLSFPFLFAAVPLWAIDYDAPGLAPFRRCWFSDGGISSNFPMHLFDGLVPSWPTFGINLEPQIEKWEEVYLPRVYTEGYGERWDRFDDGADGAARFGGFLSAILGAMQNWNDNALARMPGVRDRIARVRLRPDEGGMNLNMDRRAIENVAERGERAAAELIAAFAQPRGGSQATGWDEQRWVRLGVLLKMIEERASGVRTALDPSCPHATDFDTLIGNAGDPNRPPPAGYETPLTRVQQDALRAVVTALGVLVGTLAQPGCQTEFKPIPKPELRVRPPL